jgi:hypothetical protein
MEKKQDFFEDKRFPFTMRIKMLRRINTLETENSALKESIKDELYKEFMAKLGEPMEMKRLKNDNKRLRLQVKELKEIIKEGK